MTDADIIAEGAWYGEWLEPERVNIPPASRRGWPHRVAVVGGLKFDQAQAEAWLHGLRDKYPGRTIVTGSSRGSEAFVRELAAELGFTVEVPDIPDGFQPEWQVTDILCGADVVVTVGTPNGKRAAVAAGIHRRVDAWRENGRPLVNIAALPGKEKAPAV